jgi:uncharacterized protein (DUF58 family)
MNSKEITQKVRQIEIHTRQLVSSAVSGAYHSSFKGRGMDFEEVREYASGDDVRFIDWNVSAKMDRPFVKVFREERELSVLLLIDLSHSGNFASIHQSKRELAAEIASVLAFSASLNSDKVGLILYTDHVEHVIPPRKGRRHSLRLIREILSYQPNHRGTNHQAALDYLNCAQRKKTVTFLISDFQNTASSGEPSELFKKLAQTNQRHDLINVVLSDQREQHLSNVGLITLEDSETGEIMEINTRDRKLRAAYATAAREQQDALEKQFKKNGLDWVQAATDAPYIPQLRRLFNQRAQRH